MTDPTDRISITPEQSPTLALAHLADRLTEVVALNLAELMDSDPAEPVHLQVHRARVALRRFRAMLAAFEPILDEDLADALHDRARRLFRILGAMRDADVMALRFQGTKREAKTAAEAAHQRQKGCRALKRKKAAGFRDWVLKRLSGKSWRRGGKKAQALREAPVAQLASRALSRAWATAQSNGPDLVSMSLRAQHELRKDLKMLRYLTEFFADLWPGAAFDRFLACLRALQDDLGEVTDAATAMALGHAEDADTTLPQQRAAEAWTSLLAQGPWWDVAEPPAA